MGPALPIPPPGLARRELEATRREIAEQRALLAKLGLGLDEPPPAETDSQPQAPEPPQQPPETPAQED